MQTITLAEIISVVRQLSDSAKLRLIPILAEDLDKDVSPLEPFKTYDLSTPYDSLGAGSVLMEVT